MHLLNNAIQSIRIGVEDFDTKQPDREISAVRNIYAGILLLYKEKLRLLSPGDTNESLVKAKIIPKKLNDGSIIHVGAGKKTVNVQQIKERFENLGIEIEWKRFNNLSNIRNDIEHYYTNQSPDAIKEALSESFLLIRDFISRYLECEPIEILEQNCWNILLQNAEIFNKEKEECLDSLYSLSLPYQELEDILTEAKCTNCLSSLIKFTNIIESDLYEIDVICKSCGKELNFMEIAKICLQEHYSWGSYAAMTDGGEQSLEKCPECLRDSYIMEIEECVLCQYSRKDKECAMCGETPEVNDYLFNGFCSRCQRKLEKDD